MLMEAQKKIALVAHDDKKADLLAWAKHNRESLSHHTLFATGTTGKMLAHELELPVHLFQSGPLGGDQQIGAKISESEIDCLVFFWDPMDTQPHDTDVKALLRLATVWNIPVANNRSSADFMITSPLMTSSYNRLIPSAYEDYLNRIDPEKVSA